MRESLPASWGQWLDKLPFVEHLTTDEQQRLAGLMRVFLEEKYFEGCQGFVITDKVRVVIAAQACLLILNLHHDFYHKVQTILVYPSTFLHPSPQTEDNQAVGFPVQGEAWLDGPVVLAWDYAYEGGRHAHDGQNTVFHEFAHKLDMLDGSIDGIPPFATNQAEETKILLEEYRGHAIAVEQEQATLLDPYGAQNPAEFFAVSTEVFFEQPQQLQQTHPRLYQLLSKFYRQDPAQKF